MSCLRPCVHMCLHFYLSNYLPFLASIHVRPDNPPSILFPAVLLSLVPSRFLFYFLSYSHLPLLPLLPSAIFTFPLFFQSSIFIISLFLMFLASPNLTILFPSHLLSSFHSFSALYIFLQPYLPSSFLSVSYRLHSTLSFSGLFPSVIVILSFFPSHLFHLDHVHLFSSLFAFTLLQTRLFSYS